MKALIAIEYDNEDYDAVSSALKNLVYSAKRYDCLTKTDAGTKVRLVKGKMLLNLKRADQINKIVREYEENGEQE